MDLYLHRNVGLCLRVRGATRGREEDARGKREGDYMCIIVGGEKELVIFSTHRTKGMRMRVVFSPFSDITGQLLSFWNNASFGKATPVRTPEIVLHHMVEVVLHS